MRKTFDNRAWFLVLPVVLLVAFNALIPLMTVVNYSVQDVFDATHRAFVGADWYREMLRSDAAARRACSGNSCSRGWCF